MSHGQYLLVQMFIKLFATNYKVLGILIACSICLNLNGFNGQNVYEQVSHRLLDYIKLYTSTKFAKHTWIATACLIMDRLWWIAPHFHYTEEFFAEKLSASTLTEPKKYWILRIWGKHFPMFLPFLTPLILCYHIAHFCTFQELLDLVKSEVSFNLIQRFTFYGKN